MINNSNPGQIAVFDLDGTLVNGDTVSLFLDCLLKHKIITSEYQSYSNGLLEQFAAGVLDIKSFYTYCLKPLIGWDKSRLAEIFPDYLENSIKPIIYQEGAELIKEYQSEGIHVIAASATFDFIVHAVAVDLLNVDEIIATKVVLNNQGQITGKTVKEISHQEGKVYLLKKLLKEKGWNLKNSIGYGDTINDFPFLNIMDHSVAVNAKGKLIEIAKQKGWEIKNFA